MTDIDIESLQSEFIRLEKLVLTAAELRDSENPKEIDAMRACLNCAEISLNYCRDTLFVTA